jgi:hypothetical protein
VTDDEIFTRLLYHGRVQMGMSEREFWLMSIGQFLDLRACHFQWLGLEKAARVVTIDDVVPSSIV